MKRNGIIYLSCMACLVCSCMASQEISMPDNLVPVEGIVQDTEGNPVNHIKVTIVQRDNNDEPAIAYTSDKGRFSTLLNMTFTEFPVIIDIRLEDIDGEDNGGHFETMTDQISIFEAMDQDIVPITTPTYRLTHATDEESIPQSL